MQAEGSDVRRLTRAPAKEDHGTRSPDGKRIAYQHEHQGNTDVYAMNGDK
ncbi:MAG: PD40 domain-containing protein [Planctomycetes bacterium]|nr:PD40 domain-containing protein [Planctomycetota bacterium]